MRLSRAWQGFLATTGGVVLLASLGGVGLARFATGGETAAMASRDGGETRLGNPEALAADQYASLAGYAPTVQPACIGCGPGLWERRAITRDRAFERQLAAYEAHLDEAERAPAPEPAPVYRDWPAEQRVAMAEDAFEDLGQVATLDGVGGPEEGEDY